MSGDLRGGAQGDESAALASELLADPDFLVAADSSRVVGLLDLASSPSERLAAAIYRASAQIHHDADAATRRHILAVDAARYGDRDLSDRLASVELPGVPDARWRVDWATGSAVHPGFIGSSLGSPGYLGSLGSLGLAQGLPTGSVHGVGCAGPDSVTSGGRTYALAGDDARITVRDSGTGQLLGELKSDGDDLESWAVVTLSGRLHIVTGSFLGKVELWDLATCTRIGPAGQSSDRELRLVVAATIDGRPHVLVRGCNPYVGTPLDTMSVWSLDPLQQIDRLPVGAEQVETATVNGRSLAVLDDTQLWELSAAPPIGTRTRGHTAAITSITTTILNDRPVVVSASDDETLRLRDLVTGAPVGRPLSSATPDYDGMTRVRATLLDGHPYAVTDHDSGYHTYARAWDLAAGCELADDTAAALAEPLLDAINDERNTPSIPLNGRTYTATFVPDADPALRLHDPHTDEEPGDDPFGLLTTTRVTAFAACARRVAAIANLRRVRVWDLTTPTPTLTSELVFPHTVKALAVSPDGRLVVGFGNDLAVLSSR